MKENSIKNERSSIKEDIERLKLCSTNQCHICGRYEKEECMLERNRCEQHILSDYKRVLKENEELKEDIKNNNVMTAMAQVVENQKYYIFRKQMEKYEELIKRLKKENEELKIKNNAIKRESEAYAEDMIRLDNELNLEKEKSKYEWIRQNCLPQELVNKLYIPIQKVKDKIEEYKNMLKTCNKAKYIDRIKAINERILELQELIENEIDIDSIEELEVRQNYGCEIINEDNIHLLFKRQNQILQAVKQIDKRVKKLEGK